MNVASVLARIPLRSALLAAAVVAALVAVAEPNIHAGRAPTLRVLVHDASASCGARAAPAEDEIAALVEGLGSDDRVAVISFGADLRRVAQCAPSEVRNALNGLAPDPHGSSLFGALAEVANPASRRADVSAGRRLEVVLATDGLATDAPEQPLGNALTMLRDAGCASMRVLRRPPVATASLVGELRGPGAARIGEPFALEARGVAATDDAEIELSDASGVVETRRVRGAGAFRLVFTRIADVAGPALFTARLAGERGIPPATARVAVSAPGRVLAFGAVPRVVPGVDADVRPAAALRDEGLAQLLAAHDLVLLDDVPDASLDAANETLRRYVERGGGLLLCGGAHSFGAGGWAGRPVEQISPLVARPREEGGTLLYVALDGSGSMGEPWSGAPGAASRDAIVKGAAASLLASAAADTTLVVRRFSYDLLPLGAAAQLVLPASAPRTWVRELAEFPPPGGSTALLPPLREALSLAAARSERRKAALVLTDGRTPERAEDLHGALVALDAAEVRVTFVLPGGDSLDDDARSLRDAVKGTKAAVIGATSPERLVAAFRGVEESARVDAPIVEGRRLRADDAAGVLTADAVPESAVRVDRVWLAEGARALVVTDRGEPVGALRRVGLGTVAALATRPGDPEWLAPGDAATRLVASLARAAARPASGRVRVERDGDSTLRVRYDALPGETLPAFVEFGTTGRTRVPLVPGAGGLLSATLGARASPEWVDLVAADGRVLAGVGFYTPAPLEYRGPEPVDLDAVAALASRDDTAPARPLLPWFAGASVVLALASVAAGRVKSPASFAR